MTQDNQRLADGFDSPWLNTARAARYCGLSKRTLEGYRRGGGGPAYHRPGTKVVYDRADLDTWIRASRAEHTLQERLAGRLG